MRRDPGKQKRRVTLAFFVPVFSSTGTTKTKVQRSVQMENLNSGVARPFHVCYFDCGKIVPLFGFSLHDN